jgi:hypothetical protein
MAHPDYVPLVQLEENSQCTREMRGPMSRVESLIQQVFDTSIRNQQE